MLKRTIAVCSTLLLAGASSAQVQVQGYQRSDGTYVQGYQRTRPDNTTSNNYDTPGNYNPNRNTYSSMPSYNPPRNDSGRQLLGGGYQPLGGTPN